MKTIINERLAKILNSKKIEKYMRNKLLYCFIHLLIMISNKVSYLIRKYATEEQYYIDNNSNEKQNIFNMKNFRGKIEN